MSEIAERLQQTRHQEKRPALTSEQEELFDLRDEIFEIKEANIALRSEVRRLRAMLFRINILPASWGIKGATHRLLMTMYEDPHGFITTDEFARVTVRDFGRKNYSPYTHSAVLAQLRKAVAPHGIKIQVIKKRGYCLSSNASSIIEKALKMQSDEDHEKEMEIADV